MLIAAPGVGKSTFALNWAVNSGLPALYFSPDTDERTLSIQASTLVIEGANRDQIEHLVEQQDALFIREVNAQLSSLVLDFRPAPSFKSIAEGIDCLVTYWGHAPRLVVIDTVSDIHGRGDGYEAWQRQWLNLRTLARMYNLAIIGCHHVRGGMARTGKHPPQMGDAKYGADEYAELVLGFHRDAADHLVCSVLKNRTGPVGHVAAFTAANGFTRLEEM